MATRGVNWRTLKEFPESPPIYDMAVSEDGATILVTASAGGVGIVYRSLDGGETWESATAPSSSDLSVGRCSMSADGSYQVITTFYKECWFSTDYGASWSAPNVVYGDQVYVHHTNSNIQSAFTRYGGSNYGYYTTDNWNTNYLLVATSQSYSSVAASSDASIWVITRDGTGAYLDQDSIQEYGNIWTELTDVSGWGAIRVGMSSDGQYITLAGWDSSGAVEKELLVSDDSGSTWATRDFTRRWVDIVVSDSGQYQAAVAFNATSEVYELYYSENYGVTWTKKSDYNGGSRVCMARAGKALYSFSGSSIKVSIAGEVEVSATATGSDTLSAVRPWVEEIYEEQGSEDTLSRSPDERYIEETTSAVYGTGPFLYDTVTKMNLPQVCINWRREARPDQVVYPDYGRSNVSLSDTGQYQLECVSNASGPVPVYLSSDYGNSWVACTDLGTGIFWGGMSGSGQYCSVKSGTSVYASTNYGVDWDMVQTISGQPTGQIVMSTSGQYQYMPHDNYLYRSTDYGSTWAECTSGLGIKTFVSAATSNDGATVLASSYYNLYLSTNGGDSWSILSPPLHSSSITWVSSDGNRLITYTTAYGVLYAVCFSLDAGATWLPYKITPVINPSLNSGMAFSDSWDSIVFVTNRRAYRTKNFGLTWEYTEDPIPENGGGSCTLAATKDHTRFVVAGPRCGYYQAVVGEVSWTEVAAGSDEFANQLLVTLEETGSPSDEVEHNIKMPALLTMSGSGYDEVSWEKESNMAVSDTFLVQSLILQEAEVGEATVNSSIADQIVVFTMGQHIPYLVDIGIEANSIIPMSVELDPLSWEEDILQVNSTAVGIKDFGSHYIRSGISEYVEVSSDWAMNSCILDGTTAIRAYTYKVFLDGEDVTSKILDCSVSYSIDQFCGEVSITWSDTSLYKRVDCSDLRRNYMRERVVVYINDVILGRFFLEKRDISMTYGKESVVSWGRTAPAKLSSPYSLPISTPRPLWRVLSTAKAIAEDLAAMEGITLDWQILDYPVRAGKFNIVSQYPIDGIKRLASAVGGIVTTSRFSSKLIVRYKWLS